MPLSKEDYREYNRKRMRKARAKVAQNSEDVQPVTPVQPENVQPIVVQPKMIPADQLSPTEPYDHDRAVEHMMRMRPVFALFTRTTPNGISYHPIEGWEQGERFEYKPFAIKTDPARRARLKKVIEVLSTEKVAVRA